MVDETAPQDCEVSSRSQRRYLSRIPRSPGQDIDTLNILDVLRRISHVGFDTIFWVRNVILYLSETAEPTVAHPVNDRV
jgi:hypothetical protein